jgi:hypothetical protein
MTQRLSDEDYFGSSRVVGACGMLPQMAAQLDPSLPLRPGELLLDAEHLNLDAASARQLRSQCAGAGGLA